MHENAFKKALFKFLNTTFVKCNFFFVESEANGYDFFCFAFVLQTQTNGKYF